MATAYVRGVLKTLREGKSIGSYAVKWTNLPDSLKSSTAYRLGAYPETEFRSQLAAIREALKEGKKKNLTDITIVTDAKFFPYFYRNGWKTSRGETVANKYFYDQICELVEDFNEVKFRHEVPKNNETWKELEKKCEEGFHCTIPTTDTSEYKLSIEQITHDPKQFEGTGITRVRYFVNKPGIERGIVWDNVDGGEAPIKEKVELVPNKREALNMKRILKLVKFILLLLFIYFDLNFFLSTIKQK
ncbi:hypothetical protein WR25_16573 isoform B [Diploscapter pachys]|uniref:Uncharacterized protein n=1 Tax=Diploscapter pachys TaxID=2018661 RepID=A0A2A2LAU7_9BILA|nr:hypothetical protein WR25_16573 isoform A [Diploscapter pachys]PAV83185.1 hypothetical protein WR25_16573 isoform B [Diploscapter pachys]